jgi:hypothetical protein
VESATGTKITDGSGSRIYSPSNLRETNLALLCATRVRPFFGDGYWKKK